MSSAAALDRIVDQPRAKDLLVAAVQEDRLCHAYLFVGAPGSGMEDAAWAQMRLEPDGTLLLMAGGVECGQGHDTVVVQLAAEALGLPMERIRISPMDSSYSLDGGITTASRLTFVYPHIESGIAVIAILECGVVPGKLELVFPAQLQVDDFQRRVRR